jgi:hypothetical protein
MNPDAFLFGSENNAPNFHFFWKLIWATPINQDGAS